MSKKASVLSYLTTLLGAIGVGVNIVLSEILYRNIDDFFDTPPWYRWFMYASLLLCGVGIVCSILFRDRSNTSRVEAWIAAAFLIVGIVLIIGIVLFFEESFAMDVLVCVGGLFFVLGFFGLISTEIGLHRSPRRGTSETSEQIHAKTEVNDLVVSVIMHLHEKSEWGAHMERLTEEERTAIVVRTFMDEVLNGGFEQFLYNSSGAYFSELIDAFERVGAEKYLAIYRDLIAQFPQQLPTDPNARDRVFDEIVPRVEPAISECDFAFFNVEDAYHDEILYRYIKQNEEHFR